MRDFFFDTANIPFIKDTTLKDSQESVIKNTSEKTLTDDSKLSKIDRFFKQKGEIYCDGGCEIYFIYKPEWEVGKPKK